MTSLTTHKSLFDPATLQDPLWQKAPSLVVTTLATPPGMQSSEYLQKTYQDGGWGHVREVRVQGWQSRHSLTVALEFASTNAHRQFMGPDHFLDRVALFFPSDNNTMFMTMGSAESPGLIWSWRADGQVERLEARGPGTLKRLGNEGLRAQGEHGNGRWRVMLSGPQIKGTPRQFAVAVWSGAHQERAGLKAFSSDWIVLDAL